MLTMISNFTVYSKPGCPWCAMVEHELSMRGETFDLIVLRTDQERQEFKLKHDIKTFPQVFMGTTRLGGYDDTKRVLDMAIAA